MGAGCELRRFGPAPPRPPAQGQWRRPPPGVAGTQAAAPGDPAAPPSPQPREATCGRGLAWEAWEGGGRRPAAGVAGGVAGGSETLCRLHSQTVQARLDSVSLY